MASSSAPIRCRSVSPSPRSATPFAAITGPSFSKSITEGLKKTNELLNQEILDLRAQVKILELELQKAKKKAEEAMAVAAEESAKCRAANEMIKSLTGQGILSSNGRDDHPEVRLANASVDNGNQFEAEWHRIGTRKNVDGNAAVHSREEMNTEETKFRYEKEAWEKEYAKSARIKEGQKISRRERKRREEEEREQRRREKEEIERRRMSDWQREREKDRQKIESAVRSARQRIEAEARQKAEAEARRRVKEAEAQRRAEEAAAAVGMSQ